MKKQLPTDGITNELSGASIFFQNHSPEPGLQLQVTSIPALPSDDQQQIVQPTSIDDDDEQKQVQKAPVASVQTQQLNRSEASNHATMQPSEHLTIALEKQGETTPSTQPITMSRNHPLTQPSTIEEIRKVVKQVGKEAATYRLTQTEKQQLADIVYTYKRLGYRTSDNELARIALNWLVLDYQEQGEQSVLARALESLHR